MYPVFDRHNIDLDAELIRMMADETSEGGCRRRATAFNVIYDHRVAEGREPGFRACLARRRGSLSDGLRQYWEDRTRNLTPDYLDDKMNAGNFIAGLRWKLDRVDPDTSLLRVVNLSRETRLYTWALLEEGDEYFRPVVEAIGEKRYHDEIGKKLRPDPERFLRKYFSTSKRRRDALVKKGDSDASGPVWVALEDQFWDGVKAPKSDIARWFEAVGVDPGDGPVWAVTVAYPVKRVGGLVRPTVLDTGGYPFHFPTSPGMDLRIGGYMMDLAPSPVNLRSEFIHDPIALDYEDWKLTGHHWGETKRKVSQGIVRQRNEHYTLMCGEDPGVPAWMPRCI